MNRDLWIAMVGGVAGWFLGPVLAVLAAHLMNRAMDRIEAREWARMASRKKAMTLALADHIIKKKTHRPGLFLRIDEAHQGPEKNLESGGPDHCKV